LRWLAERVVVDIPDYANHLTRRFVETRTDASAYEDLRAQRIIVPP